MTYPMTTILQLLLDDVVQKILFFSNFHRGFAVGKFCGPQNSE